MKDIRRATRKQYSAEEKIRIVLDGLRGEHSIAELCRRNGWFAARPSGTEDIYKIYAESFRSADHLRQIQKEAQNTIASVFENAKAVRCAPKARVTSGGRFHPESCRLIW